MRRSLLFGAMAAIGMAWGLTIPMTKIAVSTGHQPIGLIAWQTLFMTAVLTVIILYRRGRFPVSGAALVLYAVIATTGTLVPNFFSYRAAAELPGGILAIVIALVPMFALPIALVLGLERPQASRWLGLVLGAAAVAMIAGPEASLPGTGDTFWLMIALLAPVCYGIEGNYLAYRGTGGLDPIEVLWGASVAALLVSAPAAIAFGGWIDLSAPWGAPEWALLVAATAHVAAYCGYVWLVGVAGPVFAAQVAYVVTAAGVIWSMLILGERYVLWVWAAFVLMMIGISLVQPHRDPAQDDRDGLSRRRTWSMLPRRGRAGPR